MIATTIEQGHRLLFAGVDPGTADLWWNLYSVTYDFGHAMEVKTEKPHLCDFNWFNREENIPAWSIGGLIDLLKERGKVVEFSSDDSSEEIIETLVEALIND